MPGDWASFYNRGRSSGIGMFRNEMVNLIYEGVLDPPFWDVFLAQFADTVRADTAGLVTHDENGRFATIDRAVGMDPLVRNAYEKYYVTRNPWLALREHTLHNVVTGIQLVKKEDLIKTDFYNEFLKPNHWLYACACVTRIKDSTYSSLYAMRSEHGRTFDSGDMNLYSFLSTHLDTAIRLHDRIADLEAGLGRVIVGDIDVAVLAAKGLTSAEARLACALYKGQTVEAYAKEAEITVNTARWFVRRIYTKIGVTKQGELIKALNRHYLQ